MTRALVAAASVAVLVAAAVLAVTHGAWAAAYVDGDRSTGRCEECHEPVLYLGPQNQVADLMAASNDHRCKKAV